MDSSSSSEVAGDRWVRPLNVSPGHWKKQLPGKILARAAQGKLDELRSIVRDSPDVLNHQGSHGRTLLFEAVRKNRRETVEWLLQRGANIHLTGCYNSETFVQLDPLSAAKFYGRKQLVDLLSQHGASSDVFRSAFCGDQSAVERYLESDPDLLYAEDEHDEIYYSPIASFCVAGGQLSLLEDLTRRGARLTPYSSQLLFIASHFENLSILQFLLDHDVSPHASDSGIWMSTNNLDVLKLLVDHGLSPNQRPYRQLHPLMYACRADKRPGLDKARFLLDIGAKVNAIGPQGRTALHYAARTGSVALCELLLQAGADATIRDQSGKQPIDAARDANRVEVVQLLNNA